MATFTTNFQTLSAIEDANTDKNNTLPVLDGLMDGMLNGFLSDFNNGTYGEQVSASSLKAYTYAGGMLSATGSFSSSSLTITSIKYQDYSPQSTLSMYGSVKGDMYGNLWGSVTRMAYSSSTLNFDIAGKISVTDTSNYSMNRISVSYVAGGVTYKEVMTGNMLVNAFSGEVTGTVNSFYMSVDDGTPRYIQAGNFSQDAALFFDDLAAESVMAVALSGADTIQGVGDNQDIYGYGGNDKLISGGAATAMYGGAGNDTYVVNDVADTAVEVIGEGTDLVQVLIAAAGGTYTLGANVENATLLNKVAFNLTGNELDNVLTGNVAANVLDGGVGADTLIGGAGNDTYIVDNAGDVVTEAVNGGTDTVESSVTYTLGANVENLTLTGSNDINGTGNILANVLKGNAGANVLTGGAGNDTYYVSMGDTVVEQANSGTDTIVSDISFDLTAAPKVENLTLKVGTGDIDGIGNELANVITGNGGDNTLTGGGGIDTLKGELGDDIYVVDLAQVGTGATATVKLQDTVTELAGQGTDAIVLQGDFSALSKTSTLVLGANIEILDASGTGDTKLNVTGNVLNNILQGNHAANVLDGGAGNDILDGEEGDDKLLGGLGNDTLYGDQGNDTLDGGAGDDHMEGGADDDFYILDSAGDTVFEYNNEGIDTIKIGFGLAGSSIDLANYGNVENATLTNKVAFNLIGTNEDNILIGNAAANILTGNGGNDILDGGLGADRLLGGLGDDIYVIDNVGDVIAEAAGEGTDTVKSTMNVDLTQVKFAEIEHATLLGVAALNLTGNADNNILTGNDGINIINGGLGADTMAGGKGNDTYVVDNAGDTVTEGFNAGVDLVKSSVSFELGANLENLTLTGSGHIDGTGNTFANVITGNNGDNTLTGGGGVDTLKGGLGNDIYVVDLAQVGTGAAATVKLQDTVTELAGQGTDAIVLQGDFSALNKTSTLVLGANIEILDASATGGTRLNVTGNALNNILQGNHAANILDGGAGNDILDGDEGDDRLLGGLGNDTLYGDQGDDTLDGGAGNDRLEGGSSSDKLTGGAGNDIFVFNPGESNSGSSDVVTDFSAGDRIMLAGFADEGGVFSNLTFDSSSKILTVAGSGTSFDGTEIRLTGFNGPITESMFVFNAIENEGAAYTDISADQAIVGNLSTYQDIDKYKITLGADDVMQLRFDVPGADAAASASSFKVAVSDSLGNVLHSWLVAADSTLTLPTGMAGDYYVSVTGTDAAHYRGDFYTLTAQTQNSTALTVDATSTTGNIAATGEVDTYSVELVAGRTYNFDVSGETMSNGVYELWNPKMTLWGPDGQELAVRNDMSYAKNGESGIVLDPHLAFTAPISGTYTVAIGAGKLMEVGEDLFIPGGVPTSDTHDGKGSYGLSVSEMDLSEQKETMLDNVQWGAVHGDPVTIYYDFQTADINLQSTSAGNQYGYANISAFGSALQTQAHAWLSEWSDVSGVNFVYDEGQATLHFALGDGPNGSTGSAWRYDSNGMALWGTTPDQPAQIINTADVTLAKQLEEGDSYYHLFQHEVGHALGLTHPAEYAFNNRFNSEAPLGLGNDDFTIMSYNDTNAVGEPYYQGLRLLDIAAIQDLYGANMQYKTGDTTWEFNDKTHAYKTAIWDAGGIDTIDASGQTLDSVINLTPGTLSSIGIFGMWADASPAEAAGMLVPGEFADQAYGNVGIAFGADIENATAGSGNDYISGNDLGNILKGNAGADLLNGANGNDTLIGGAGNDILIGGLGSDTFRFELNGGVDTVRDFVSGTDKLEFYDLISPDSINGLDGLLEAAFGNGATATTTDQRILYDQSTGNLHFDRDGSAAQYQSELIASLGAGTSLLVEDISVRNGGGL